jgi:hypothetical protein
MECILDKWIQLVGVIDCLDDPTIHEYKTGAASSLTYIKTMQIPVYQVLAEENGYSPNAGIVHHFNQYTNKVTRSKRYLSEATSLLAREWIHTYASELREALRETGNL